MTPTCADLLQPQGIHIRHNGHTVGVAHIDAGDPPEVIVHHSDSGYFLWIELPEGADASELSARALASHISIAPGKMFSTSASWTSFFRFNTAWGWGEREEQGVRRLGELIREQLT